MLESISLVTWGQVLAVSLYNSLCILSLLAEAEKASTQ